MIEQSESIQDLAFALNAAQGHLTNMARDAEGQIGKRKYRYATLGNLADHIRPVMAEHGLSYTQSLSIAGLSSLVCTTQIMHTSGEWMRATALVPYASEGSNQDAGVSTTYVRRYGLSAALGLVVDDDTDGASPVRQASGGQSRSYPSDDPLPGPGRVTEKQVQLFDQLTKNLDPDAIAAGLASHGYQGMGFADLSKQEGSDVISAIKERKDEKRRAKADAEG